MTPIEKLLNQASSETFSNNFNSDSNQADSISESSITSDTLLNSKLETLQMATEKKLNRLGQIQENRMITGLNDADTIKLSDGTTLRESSPNLMYDAVELKHGDNPYDMNGVDKNIDKFGKSQYSIQKQKEQVASIMNKEFGLNLTADTVTEQDMIDVGNMQQIQKLADLVRSEGEERWIAPLYRNVEQTNLSGTYVDENGNTVESPLNIPVNTSVSSSINGREIGELFNPSTGLNVTENSALDPNLNSRFDNKKYINSLISDARKETSNTLSNAKDQNLYMAGDDSIVDAVQAGAAKLAVDLGDVVLDVVTPGDNTLLNEAKKQENIDSWVGYNRYPANKAIDNATTLFKDGKYASALWEVMKEPQIVAESIPMMVEMIIPFGWATKAGRLAVQASNYQKAGNLAKAAEVSKQAAEELTEANKLMYKVANNAGFLAAVSQQTNNDLDARIENIKDGSGASLPETMAVFGSNFALLGLDRLAFNKITGIEGGKAALSNAFAISDVPGKKRILQGIAEKASGLVGAGFGEAAQEYVQGWGQILNQQLGTDKNDGDLAKIISSQENIDDAIGGMLAGFAGGMQMRSVSDTAESVYNKVSGKDIVMEKDERVRYSFSPNSQYTQRPDIQSKSPSEQNFEGFRVVDDIKRYSTSAVADAMFKGKEITDTDGNKLTPEQAISNMIDTVRYENFSNLKIVEEARANKMAEIEAIEDTESKEAELKKFNDSIISAEIADKESYVQDFVDVFKSLGRRINNDKLNISDEIKKTATDKVMQSFLNKVYSEPDEYIKNQLLSRFANDYIEASAKNTILKSDSGTFKENDTVKDSSLYGKEGKQYIDDLKNIRQMIFGSMPIATGTDGKVVELPAKQELDRKIEQFEAMYNDYNNRLDELKKTNPNATILNAKNAYEVSKEIIDGSGFIVDIMKPTKNSIVGHMNNIKRNTTKIKNDLYGSTRQTKNIDAILEPYDKLIIFSNSRSINNADAYGDIVSKYNGQNATEIARKIFEKGQDFQAIIEAVDAEKLNTFDAIRKKRELGVPVYRMEMDHSSTRISDLMIIEGNSFVENMNYARGLLKGEVSKLQMLFDDKISKNNAKKINENIDKLNLKALDLENAIKQQEANIEFLNNAKEVLANPEVTRELKRLYAVSQSKKEVAQSANNNSNQTNKDTEVPAQVIDEAKANATKVEVIEQSDVPIETEINIEGEKDGTKAEITREKDEKVKSTTETREDATKKRAGEIGQIEQAASESDTTTEAGTIQSEELASTQVPEKDSESETKIESVSGTSDNVKIVDDTEVEYELTKKEEAQAINASINVLKNEIKDIENNRKSLEYKNKNLASTMEKVKKLEKVIDTISKLKSENISKIKDINKSISEKEKELASIEIEIEKIQAQAIIDEQTQAKNKIFKDNAKKVSVSNYLFEKQFKLKNQAKYFEKSIEKLEKILENTELTENSILLAKSKIVQLEIKKNLNTYGDGSIHQAFIGIKNAEEKLNDTIHSNASEFEINNASYEVKAAKRKYKNEIAAYDIVVENSMFAIENKIAQYEDKIDSYKGSNLKVGIKVFSDKIKALRDLEYKLKNYEYPNLLSMVNEKTSIKDPTLKDLFTETRKDGTKYSLIQVPAYVNNYLKLDGKQKGIIRLKKYENIYNSMVIKVNVSSILKSKNIDEEYYKYSSIIADNYIRLKGRSFAKKINSESPKNIEVDGEIVENPERTKWEKEVADDFKYLILSKFTSDNTILKSASAILDYNENEVNINPISGMTLPDTLKALDDVNLDIVQGKIVATVKDKNGNDIEIERNEYSINLMSLLFGKTGTDYKTSTKILSEFSNAVKIETFKEIDNMYSILMIDPYNDTEQFDSVWGIDSADENSQDHRDNVLDNFVSKGYIPESVIVRSLGRRIYDSLPVSFDKNMVERYTENELITQIGIYAIGELENNPFYFDGTEYKFSRYDINLEYNEDGDIIEESKTPKKIAMNIRDGYENVFGIKLPLNINVREYALKLSNRLAYMSNEVDRKKPSLKPITEVPDTIKHKKTKLSNTAIETILDYQSVPYKFEDNITEMYNLWKNKETRNLAYMYANIFEPDVSRMSLAENKKALAKNRSERLELDTLMSFYEQVGTDTEFYLPWDFVASGRYMVSSDVNPQGSKITRFLISTYGTRTKMKIAIDADGNATLDEKQLGGIRRTMAQAFDYGLDKDLDLFVIDKMSKDVIFNQDGTIEFKDTEKGKILKTGFDYFVKTIEEQRAGTYEYDSRKNIEEATKNAKAIERLNNKSIKDEPEFEGFHAVQTVRELAKMYVNIKEAKENSKQSGTSFDLEYDSHFVIEADGITSGMMITLSQIMTDDAINLMEKGGIYTKDAIDFWNKITKDLNISGFIKTEHLADLDNGDGTYKVTHGLLNRVGKLMSDKTKIKGRTAKEYLEQLTNDKGELVYSAEDLVRADFKDFYNTIAREVTTQLAKIKEDVKFKIIAEEEKGTESGYIIAKRLQMQIDLIDYVGDSISRNMAKDPVMVFIYGSSLGSIKGKILHNLVKTTISDRMFAIAKDPSVATEKDLKMLSNIGINIVQDTQGRLLAEVPYNAKLLDIVKNKAGEYEIVPFGDERYSYSNGKKIVSVYDLDKVEINNEMLKKDDNHNGVFSESYNTYGKAFEKAFEKNFSFIGDYRDIIKAIEVVRFQIFDYKFEEKVNKLIDEKSSDGFEYNPTNEELDVIVQELINEGFGHVIKDINGGYHTFEKSETITGSKRTSLRTVKIDDKGRITEDTTQSGSIDIRKEVVNTGAAPVTSIHNQDGWKIRYATFKNGAQNLFDATITGLDNHDDIDYKYNEGFGLANTMHSILLSQLNDMENTIDLLDNDGLSNLLASIDGEKAKVSYDVFDKMSTNHIISYANKNRMSDMLNGFQSKEFKESINRFNLLDSTRGDLIINTKKIINGLARKPVDVVINHLYATDTGKQFSGTLGGFKDSKPDYNKVFNVYNDIIYKVLTIARPDDIEPANIVKGPKFTMTNKLKSNEKAKNKILMQAEELLKGKGLNLSQRERIQDIINMLVDC